MTEAEIIEEGAPLYHAILRSLIMPDFVSEEVCVWVRNKLNKVADDTLANGEEDLSAAFKMCAKVFDNGAKE